jgi:hypothetical protein
MPDAAVAELLTAAQSQSSRVAELVSATARSAREGPRSFRLDDSEVEAGAASDGDA